MDIRKRCRLLLTFREGGIRFRTFVGARWLIMKAIILVAALVLISSEDATGRAAGLVGSGYAVGTIAAGVRSYVVAKKLWPLQQELLDWHKVETRAKESVS